MQQHIIRFISVNLSKFLDVDIWPACLSFMMLSALMDVQVNKQTECVYSRHIQEVMLAFLQEMMLSARLRAWIILQLIVN